MQIKNELSREIVIRKGRKAKRSVGVPVSNGYCFLHDKKYALSQGDEMCPSCERDGLQHIAWREENYAADIYGEGTGDHNEE